MISVGTNIFADLSDIWHLLCTLGNEISLYLPDFNDECIVLAIIFQWICFKFSFNCMC